MISYIIGGQDGSLSASANRFQFPHATVNAAPWDATEANASTVVPHGLTIDNFRVTLSGSPGVGKSYAFAVMKNGVATAVTCTVSDAATAAQDLVNSVTFAPGDTISIRCVPSGTPTVRSANYNLRQSASGLFAVIGGTASTPATGATNYNGMQASGSWQATENLRAGVVPANGFIKNLYIQTSAAPGAAKQYVFAVMKNGVATGVTVTIAGASQTTGNDVANTASFAPGDTISLQSVPTGTPAAVAVKFACSFAPTNDGESFLTYANAANPSTAGTSTDEPQGTGSNWGGSGGGVFPFPVTTLKALYIALTTAPGAGKTYTETITLGGVGSALTVAITGAGTTTGNITGQSVTPTADQSVLLSSLAAGTPAATTVRAGLLISEAAYQPRPAGINFQDPAIV